MKRLAIRFQNQEAQTLSGMLSLPGRGAPRAFAAFAHCFTCGKSIRAANVICQQLAANGIAALRFDFAGLGQSDGQFADSSFSTNIGDIEAAADYLAKHYQAPKLLIGHSLASCTVITLQMYARLKGIKLDNVTVATRHSKVHASDSGSSEAKPQKIDVFEREIRLPAGLDEATRQKLLSIADRCPVHNTLHSEVRIETRLK